MVQLDGVVRVVGGGIGGFSAALALAKVGFEVEVHEQAPAVREVGAAIALWPNAMRTLDALGVGPAIAASTHPFRFAVGLSSTGRELFRTDLVALFPGGTPLPRVVHRGELLARLAAAFPAARVHTGQRVERVEAHGHGARLVLADGAALEAALVVGADGLHSRVRAGLGEDAIRPTGQRCFRGVAELEVEAPDDLAEVQGPGLRFGLCPLGPRRSAWWAVEPAEGDLPVAERKARVLEAFARFPARVVRMVEATDPGAILLNPLVDRAPRRGWSRGPVVVLGDAAHPTTPNLGQGANMAIDDGLVLARALRDAPTLEAGLAAYEAERYARTARIVEQSRRFGELGDWSHPAAVWLRELSIALAPRALLERQLRTQALESVGEL